MQYGDYTIVRYTPAHHDALLDLLSLLWGSDNQANSAYLKWKYDQNPYADRTWIYLALYEEQPVGVLGNMAMRWQVGDPIQYIDCMCNVDGAVKTEHRRKGLFEALSLLNLQDLERTSFRYFVTLSANTKSAPGIIKLGWQHVGLIQPFIRLRPVPVVGEGKIRNALRRIPLARNAYTALRSAIRKPVPSTSQPSAEKNAYDSLDSHRFRLKESYDQLSIENSARPQQMADLVTRLPTDGRMRHLRDAEYFAWRYLNPRSRYRFLFWGERQLDGYLVLQTPVRPGMHPITIVDWDGCDMVVQAELLKAAIQLGDFEVLSTWGISLTAQAIELLLQFGFARKTGKTDQEGYEPEILLRPVVEQPQDADWQVENRNLLNLENWDFRPIYSDSF